MSPIHHYSGVYVAKVCGRVYKDPKSEIINQHDKTLITNTQFMKEDKVLKLNTLSPTSKWRTTHFSYTHGQRELQ